MIKIILVFLCVIVLMLIGLYVYIDDKSNTVRSAVKTSLLSSSRWRVPTYTKYSEYVGRTPAFTCTDEDADMKIVGELATPERLAATRKTLKFTRLCYEHASETVGKNELYDLVNQLAEHLGFMEMELNAAKRANERLNTMYDATVRDRNKAEARLKQLELYAHFPCIHTQKVPVFEKEN